MCIRGVTAVEEEVLRKLADPSLRVYLVWVPVMPKDDARAAEQAAARFAAPRVRQYWDADGRLAAALGRTLEIPADDGPAWDVYLLYDRGRHWEGTPPRPDYWMHQLRGITRAPPLDGAELRAHTDALLRRRASARP
jgi:hypothetical protein